LGIAKADMTAALIAARRNAVCPRVRLLALLLALLRIMVRLPEIF
jgi:hypothetical protein